MRLMQAAEREGGSSRELRELRISLANEADRRRELAAQRGSDGAESGEGGYEARRAAMEKNLRQASAARHAASRARLEEINAMERAARAASGHGVRAARHGGDESEGKSRSKPWTAAQLAAERKAVEPGLRNMATRIANGESRFLDNLMHAGGITRAQAEQVFRVYQKHKVLKRASADGVITVKHGAYLDRSTIRRAAGEDGAESGKQRVPTKAEEADWRGETELTNEATTPEQRAAYADERQRARRKRSRKAPRGRGRRSDGAEDVDLAQPVDLMAGRPRSGKAPREPDLLPHEPGFMEKPKRGLSTPLPAPPPAPPSAFVDADPDDLPTPEDRALEPLEDEDRGELAKHKGERGFTLLEPVAYTAVATAGLIAAPRLNTAIRARPLGEHVPPSAGASLGCLVAGGLARRAGYRKTGNAGIALGVGLAVGTLTSAKADGGMLAAKA